MAESPYQQTELSLGGVTYRVRPSFKVLAAIEAALGQSARTLGIKCLAVGTTQAFRGELKEIAISELAVIVFHMTRDEKTSPISVEAIGEVLMEEGYGDLAGPIGDFLVRGLKGNREHEKEAAKATVGPRKAEAAA